MDICSHILERHVRALLSANFSDVFETTAFYNFKCTVCGDSEKDIYKKRGYVLKEKDPWVYYCHNCQTSISVVSWMKKYYNVNYKNLMMDIMRDRKNNAYYDNKEYDFKQKRASDERDESKDTEHFEKMVRFKDCVEYCKSRGIPRRVYRRWFYCTKGIYRGRIIIPFRNNETGKIYYYQGRSFNNKLGVKYLSRFGDHMAIYNYYNVDPDLPVPLLEGPIDSEFVENSIAATGLKLNGEELDKFKKLRFMLDHDNSGHVQAHKMLLKRKYVFCWEKFLKDYPCDVKAKDIKDVNDFILHNLAGITELTWDIIGEYFTNKPGDKIYFPVKKKNPQKR